LIGGRGLIDEDRITVGMRVHAIWHQAVQVGRRWGHHMFSRVSVVLA